jgi:phenylalanyl-tRNA synthetase alpha subunit
MEPEILTGLITSCTALITVTFGVLGAYWLHKREDKKTDADVADKYQQIADRAAERALKLEDRIDLLTTQIDQLKADNATQAKAYEALTKAYIILAQEHRIYKSWVERLVRQIKELGYEPVQKKEVENG